MIRQNLHTHSTFDDGQNTMEEMVRAAISAGFSSLGFSVHTPMPFPACWTIEESRLPDYVAEARRLRRAYAGQIDVFCGAEWDMLSQVPLDGFGYVIGSAHHIPAGSGRYCVDHKPEETERYLKEYFENDADAAAEAYFEFTARLASFPRVDIIGHFDILTKFDDMREFYRPDSPRYRAAALAAMDALVAAGKIFEINTGAVARGYRKTPYPSRDLLQELHKRGARVTVSSDAHTAGEIAFGFAEAERLAHECGFTEYWIYDGSAFAPVPFGGA